MVLLSSCSNNTDVKATESEITPYLSINYTTFDNGSNEDNGMTTTAYIYDLNQKEVVDFYAFPYDTQYPLGIFDKGTNRLYFSQDADGGDQIFMYDIDTEETTQLTTDLFAVNYIFPYGETIFFVTNPKDEYHRLKLGSLDVSSREITYWKDDGDTNVETLYLDRINKKIYVSAYSLEERDYNLRNQGNNGSINPEGILYETDTEFNSTRELYRREEHVMRFVLKHNNMVLTALQRTIDDKRLKSAYINIDTLEVSDFNLPDGIQRGEPAFSADGKGIYMLTVVDDKRGIYYCDLDTGDLTEVFVPEGNGFINSFIYFDSN